MKELLLWPWNKLKEGWEKFKKLIITRFPGKDMINATVGGLAFISAPIVIVMVCSFFVSSEDTSRLGTARESIRDKFAKNTEQAEKIPKSMSDKPPAKGNESTKSTVTSKRQQIVYRAKQVIERTDFSDPSSTLPPGTEFIGRLMTSIDTRDIGSIAKIELPYGGGFKGNELLPRGTTLFAAAKYNGSGEKVYFDIQAGTYPDGQEFKIRGQALSAKDFSPGVEGDYHGTFSNRVASQLGLTFVSGLTETLVEKESLGGGSTFSPSAVTAKPTLKNGLLAGATKVSESEAQRMASELSGQKPYVTIDSGKELIVSILEKFVRSR